MPGAAGGYCSPTVTLPPGLLAGKATHGASQQQLLRVLIRSPSFHSHLAVVSDFINNSVRLHWPALHLEYSNDHESLTEVTMVMATFFCCAAACSAAWSWLALPTWLTTCDSTSASPQEKRLPSARASFLAAPTCPRLLPHAELKLQSPQGH